MRYIRLSDGSEAICDEDDYEMLNRYSWQLKRNGHTQYARMNKNKQQLSMHQVVMRCCSVEIDHVNHDGLDNRKCNLRLASASSNRFNSRKHMHAASSYKGVTKHGCRWRATICKDSIAYRLGAFDTEIEAALAYNEAARKLFGSFACLNIVPKIL